MKRYSIKQISERFGVSRRTLQYYDDIGLLLAQRDPFNQYRFYNDGDVARLQQILLFKQAGLTLQAVEQVLLHPDRLPELLAEQRREIKQSKAKLLAQQQVVELLSKQLSTPLSIQNMESIMTEQNFPPLSKTQQQEYEAEAKARWDSTLVEQSNQRWRDYSNAQQRQIMQEADQIYQALAELISEDPASLVVQAQIAKWHQHLQHFYDPSPEMLAGLAELYVDDERFNKNLSRFNTALPQFLAQAISHYVSRL